MTSSQPDSKNGKPPKIKTEKGVMDVSKVGFDPLLAREIESDASQLAKGQISRSVTLVLDASVISSSLIPIADNLLDIGQSGKRWKTLYAMSAVFSSGITAGSITTAGNVQITSTASGLEVAEGTNAHMGVATLSSGSAVVSTNRVTANSRIFLTGQNTSGTAGILRVSSRIAGTSFSIGSSSGSDNRDVAWIIIEPY